MLTGLNRPRPDPTDLARVRAWALSHPHIGEEATVVVNELACREPGCPPIETVIAVLSPAPGWRVTIHKPSSQITETDIAAALAGSDPLE